MPDSMEPGPVTPTRDCCEAVCIHTKKIYDSCKDKDCIEDLRFYATTASQDILAQAQSVKGGKAELLYVCTDVEPVTFNRGFYTVDIRFFYRVVLSTFSTATRPCEIEGLCVFDKRVILFGSEGNAKIFSSQARIDGMDRQYLQRSNLPIAVVEAVDPIVLNATMTDTCNHCCNCDICEVPVCVQQCFGGDLTMGGDCRQILVTLGQFSIVRLERDSQLLMPVYDYCMPEKECTGSVDSDDPCQLFQTIAFPTDEFFPPNALDNPGDYEGVKQFCCCKR